jgi:hypothetical protein
MDSLLVSTLALAHNPWRAKMYLNSNTAVAANAAIPFTTVVYDPAGMCTTGAGAHITVPTDGMYLVTAVGQDVTTSVAWYIYIYSAATVQAYGSNSNVSGVGEVSSASTVLKCAAGDTIQATAGAATTVVGTLGTAHMTVTYIGPA